VSPSLLFSSCPNVTSNEGELTLANLEEIALLP
jgi:hypothetical protein